MKYSIPFYSQSRATIFAVLVFSAVVLAGRTQELHTNHTVLSGFEGYLLVESPDLRLTFYPSWEALREAKGHGSFLLIPDGVFEHVRQITTNECPTVEVALAKYATNHFGGLHFQTRVIQKDAIFQTPLGKDAERIARKAVLDIKLVGGDVVIVTGIE